MSERLIKVPTAEHDLYWLWVAVKDMDQAGYVRAVGVAAVATEPVRKRAADLAASLGVKVRPEEAAGGPGGAGSDGANDHSDSGFQFNTPAAPELDPPFKHGSQEGNRRR